MREKIVLKDCAKGGKCDEVTSIQSVRKFGLLISETQVNKCSRCGEVFSNVTNSCVDN